MLPTSIIVIAIITGAAGLAGAARAARSVSNQVHGSNDSSRKPVGCVHWLALVIVTFSVGVTLLFFKGEPDAKSDPNRKTLGASPDEVREQVASDFGELNAKLEKENEAINAILKNPQAAQTEMQEKAQRVANEELPKLRKALDSIEFVGPEISIVKCADRAHVFFKLEGSVPLPSDRQKVRDIVDSLHLQTPVEDRLRTGRVH
jgi:hypothetical protein